MLADQLRRAWRAREAAGLIHDEPTFLGDALVLGAGTVLAKASRTVGVARRAGDEERLKSLLWYAYGRSPDPGALGHIKAATQRWGEGDETAALLHLALARLGRLAPAREGARRLFVADCLVQSGVAPGAISKALAAATEEDAFTRQYNPDEPRVPAGNGRPSGQWTAGGASAGSTTSSKEPFKTPGKTGDKVPTSPRARVAATPSRPSLPAGGAQGKDLRDLLDGKLPGLVLFSPPTQKPGSTGVAAEETEAAAVEEVEAGAVEANVGFNLARASPEVLARTATFVGTLASRAKWLGTAFEVSTAAGGAVLALGVLLIPNPEPEGEWITVGGPNNLSYFRNPDETAIRFKYTDSRGSVQTLSASPDPDGDYRTSDGSVIARWTKVTKTAAPVLLVATGAFLSGNHDEPRLCPVPQRDRPGARSNNQDFEDHVKAILNPEGPTPRGLSYYYYNPSEKKYYSIDDCIQRFGVPTEIKGPEFEAHFDKGNIPSKGMMNKFLIQAKHQVDSIGFSHLIWIFANESVAREVRKSFQKLTMVEKKLKYGQYLGGKMRKVFDGYGIRADWGLDSERAYSVGTRLLSMVEQLAKISALPAKWRIMDFVEMEGIPLDHLPQGIAAFVERNASRDEDDELIPGGGYRLCAIGDDELSEYITPRTVTISANVGSRRNNDLHIEVGGSDDLPDPALANLPVYRAMLEALAANWPCPWAVAYAFSMDYHQVDRNPVIEHFPYSKFHMPWIAYLSADLMAGVTPPRGLQSERTLGGGWILTVTPDLLDPGNPEHLRKSLVLAELLFQRAGYARETSKTPSRVGPY